ncbi:hypothetical protein SBOR_3752 [Sclerotinia borealis F-4128]|uniref:C2H2-type domain-containing protein n=1 Tax=Sclerotinia borealis (strain F-4128) TaxID=1432307 RepID=W9CIQ0_SCLBF|nr:hypothetical protein SBOR_3752 [Sclerotinia borealis F-4128]
MSSYTSVSSHSVDAQAQHSQEEADLLSLNTHHIYNPQFDPTLLSPYNQPHTYSNSPSPYDIGSTPVESLSEYSNFGSDYSDFEDGFFTVDLDAGVQRIDSLPSSLTTYPTDTYTNVIQERSTIIESQKSSEAPTASTYPLSPKDTSIPNTPSPRSVVDGKVHSIITHHEIEIDNELSQSGFPFPEFTTTLNALQLTPDNSGSSHNSAEGVEPTSMPFRTHSPHVTVSHWAEEQSSTRRTYAPDQNQYGEQINTNSNNYQYPSQNFGQGSRPTASRNDEGLWIPNYTTGQTGLDPESRKMILDTEIPNLKEQEEHRHVNGTNIQVQLWRQRGNSTSDPNVPRSRDSTYAVQAEQAGVNLAPVDDAASIRENRFLDGQVYYNIKGESPTDVDLRLMSQPRQFNDAPALPYMTVTDFQAPSTANDAIQKWNGNADTISMMSRAATWGTRRNSESSLNDYEAVANGSFLKKLSIKSEKKASGLWPSFSSLGQRAVTRVRSNSNLSKRARSSSNVQDTTTEMNSKQNNSNSLAPPPRTSSFGKSKKPTPSLNTALAAMTGTVAAVGTSAHHPPHTRNGSSSAASPKSPLLNIPFLSRSRSKSDLSVREGGSATSVSAIGELWKRQGGPPVPTLAPQSSVEPESAISTIRYYPEPTDQDEEGEEDDEQGDEGDIKMEHAQSEPIIPTYEGFKEHVRRLNPDMNSKFNWLVSRIARQQEIRYKHLLNQRVEHMQAIVNRNCSAGPHCIALGGSATLFNAKGKARENERSAGGLQLVTDFSDDSNPGDGALTSDTFPRGVPLPPTRNLPAHFECQLCFKAKKFYKPSDWTKHVHEDVQPFTCTYDKCRESKSFKRKADWVRHENERHRHLEWWTCQVDDCRHQCFRKDNFLQHLVREHKLPEPKQKTKAAIKKAKNTELAWGMLERCHHETEKKPQDEPCRFCGKAFTTWKKLTVHLAKHMEHISLPVLQLVEQKNVDADTIISPVEQNLTPITPIGRSKLEDSRSYGMGNISPNIPMVPQFSAGFHQPAFYSTSGPSTTYGMQNSMTHTSIGQDVPNDQFPMFSNAYNVQQMNQSRQFGSMDSANLGSMHHTPAYNSIDTDFVNSKFDQSHSAFGAIDTSFNQNKVDQPRSAFGSIGSNTYQMQSNQNFNHTPHSAIDFSMGQSFVTTSPPVSAYQAPHMLDMTDTNTFGFDSLTVGPMTNFQQVPMSRAQSSSSSYGQSPQNMQHSPQNMQYYGHQ